MVFPIDPCYVCTKHIADISKGYIIMNDYASEYARISQEESLDQMLANPLADFMNQITWQYFHQFPEVFHEDTGITSLQEMMALRERDMNDTYRLRSVIKAAEQGKGPANTMTVYLLAHHLCVRDDVSYYIDLPKIDTPRKALNWQFHLGDKNWHHPQGWNLVLESLFGRGGVQQ